MLQYLIISLAPSVLVHYSTYSRSSKCEHKASTEMWIDVHPNYFGMYVSYFWNVCVCASVRVYKYICVCCLKCINACVRVRMFVYLLVHMCTCARFSAYVKYMRSRPIILRCFFIFIKFVIV